MTEHRAPTLTEPDRHALDFDVHLHVAVEALSGHTPTPTGLHLATYAQQLGKGDRCRARSSLINSAIRATAAGEYTEAVAMLDAFLVVSIADLTDLLREDTP